MSHNLVNPVDINDSSDTTKKIRLDPSGATTNTTATISTAQTANRTYSIPDSGASAAFVMTEGTQTINGTKTFTTSLKIKETSGSDTITLQAPALGSSYTLTLPTDDGTSNNQVLTTDGSGVLSWQSFLPAGMLLPFAGSATPSGFLLCDGSAVNRTTYANLFAAIGTTWGVGDGSTTFNLPNLSRRTLVGSGGSGTATLANTTGSTGGSETHTLITAELPSHTHGAGTLANSTSSVSGTAQSNTTGVTTTSSGSSHSHTAVSGKDDIGGTSNGFDINNTGDDVATDFSNFLFIGADGSHTHGVSDPGHTHTLSGTAAAQTISGSTGTAGSGDPHNNMQPSAVVTYVIKY